MANISITTNGTIEGTVLTVDGADITKTEKIVSIQMQAYAPFKSEYSGDTIPGMVDIRYQKANDDGTLESKSVSSGADRSSCGIGQIKSDDQVIRHIGQDADVSIVKIVDKIVDHCTKNKIKIPERTNLLNRTIKSLTDKCEDLGIKLEDNIPATV